MRQSVPDIHLKLRAVQESRPPLASTMVVVEGAQYLVVTLAPLITSRLMRRRPRGLWESRVYAFDPGVKVGLGVAPRYAVLSGNQAEALARHEALVARLEQGTFEIDSAQEILARIRPLVESGAAAFQAGYPREAVADFDESIRIARVMDLVCCFFHLYQEAHLMRALALECLDQAAAKGAYREFIRLYADLRSPDPETVRGVAWARAAIERLTPTPQDGPGRDRDRGIVAEGAGGAGPWSAAG